MITVNRGVRHRTRPIAERSVKLTFERAGNSGDVRRRRVNRRRPVFESCDPVQVVAAATRFAGTVGSQRHPEVGRPGRRETETSRHHADDQMRVFVQRDLLAEDVGSAAEACLPRSVTEHHRLGR